MTPRKWTSFFVAATILLTSQASFSQTDRTVKRNVATVLFASLGGAILGLSTLSFYGEPQEHTDNISLGALAGFVGGVGYILYDSSRPAVSYDTTQIFDQDIKSRRALASVAKAPLLFQFSYDF